MPALLIAAASVFAMSTASLNADAVGRYERSPPMTQLTLPTTVLTLLATLSLAQASPKHHDGLYVRANPGFSANSGSIELTNGDELGLSGVAAQLGVGIGYAVTPNILIGARASSQIVVAPTLELNGVGGDTNDEVAWGLHLLGGEADYYFTPINLYVGLSLGALIMTTDLPDRETRVDNGFGAALAVGKEWWVADEIGLGVVAELTAGSVPAANDQTWTIATFGIALSATLN